MLDKRTPPQDLDSERALLGALLIAHQFERWADCDVDEIRSIVGAEMFYAVPEHRAVFRAIAETHEVGEPIDPTAILPRLRNIDATLDWAETLRDLNIEGDPANGPFYARQIRDCWRKRELIRLCDKIKDDAYNPILGPDDIVAALSTGLDRIEQTGCGDKEARTESEVIRALENPRNTAGDKIPVTLGQLGNMLDHGLERGTLTVIGARPSCGKTSLGWGLCSHVSHATEGCASLFASCEMTDKQIGLRALALRSRLSVRSIQRGDIDDSDFVTARNKAALEADADRTIFILDGVKDARSIAAHARRHARKHEVGLVVIDYLQLLEIAGKFDRHDLRIGAMSKLFKMLALETNIAVVLLSQLSRASEREGRKPRLSDLRDSGNVEQDADNIILIHKGSDNGPICDTTLIVAKQRQGDTGEALLCYRKETMSYEARYIAPEGPVAV